MTPPVSGTPANTTPIAEEETLTIATTPVIEKAPEKTPSAAPIKFSLSSLKQNGTPAVSQKVAAVEPEKTAPAADISDSTESNVEEAWKPAVVAEEIVTVSNIVQETDVIESLDLTADEPKEVIKGVDDIAKEVIAEKQETLTIATEEIKEAAPVASEEKKEFFPNLDVLGEFDFIDDEVLGNRPEILAKKETPKEEKITFSQENESLVAIGTEPVEAVVEAPADVVSESVIQEAAPIISENTSEIMIDAEPTTATEIIETIEAEQPVTAGEETAPVTAEYVSEVKQELSEERKPGGLKKFTKTLIAASLGGILLIGGMFGVGAILKHNKTPIKSNVQETVVTPPPVQVQIPTTTEPTPSNTTPETPTPTQTAPETPQPGNQINPSEIQNYVQGVDYQVIPNTKKNIKREKKPEMPQQ